MSRKGSTNIEEYHIIKVCDAITIWRHSKITYTDIMLLSIPILGYKPNKKTLLEFGSVYDAYKKQHIDFKNQGLKKRKSDKTLIKQNKALKEEITELERQKKAIIESLGILQYKAIKSLGMDAKKLRQPLTRINRAIKANGGNNK